MSKKMDLTNKTLHELQADMEKQAQAWNTAFLDKDYAAQAQATETLNELEAAYAALAKKQHLELYASDATPIAKYLEHCEYTVLKTKETANEETKVVTKSVNSVTKEITLTDLAAAFPKSIANTNWKHYAEQLNLRLCLYVANELSFNSTQRSKIENEFRISEAGRGIDLGGTPASNTQLLKALQRVLDAIYGENPVKATSHDVTFMQMAYTQMGKKLCTVRTQNTRNLANRTLMSVLKNLVTGCGYGIDYPINRGTNNSGSVTEVKPAKKNPKSKSKDVSKPAAKPAAKEATMDAAAE